MKRLLWTVSVLSGLAMAQATPTDEEKTPPPPPPVLTGASSSAAIVEPSVVPSSSSVEATPVATSSAVASSSSVATKVEAPAKVQAPVSSSAVSSSTVASSSSAADVKSAVATSSAANSSDAKSSDSKSEGAKADGESSGPSFTGGVAVGLVTIDGEQVTRISFRPELAIGPLGIGLDLELFVSGEGQFKKTGWEFDTKDQTLNSIYRKIYYLRWNQPGDMFYARIGALENITMDVAGLITNGYGNVANYPSQKLVGTHVQLNNVLDPWGLSVEAMNNSLEDWNHGGGLAGLRMSLTPLGITKVPVLSGLRVGVTGVRDFNQYATIPDADNDNCPDMLDEIEGEGCKYLKGYLDNDSLEYYYESDPNGIKSWMDRADSKRDAEESAIVDRFGSNDAFTMAGLDASLPIISSDLLTFGIYTEYARPFVDDKTDSMNLNESWAYVPLGAGLKVWKLDMGLEYRMVNGRFQVGTFDAGYEMTRVRYLNGEYQTKEQSVWEAAEDLGMSKGVYGRMGMDLFGFATLSGDYSQMWGENDSLDRAASAKLQIGKTVTELVPKIALAEIFVSKDHIYADGDDFFDPSIYATYGYRVGMNLGGGMTLVVGKYTTYTRNPEGELEAQSNFTAETMVTF